MQEIALYSGAIACGESRDAAYKPSRFHGMASSLSCSFCVVIEFVCLTTRQSISPAKSTTFSEEDSYEYKTDLSTDTGCDLLLSIMSLLCLAKAHMTIFRYSHAIDHAYFGSGIVA